LVKVPQTRRPALRQSDEPLRPQGATATKGSSRSRNGEMCSGPAVNFLPQEPAGEKGKELPAMENSTHLSSEKPGSLP